MTAIDWAIVLGLNGAVVLLGFYLARGTQSSGQWFLGGRSLPWWAVGLSMFATNVDNADLVAVTGNTFNEGLHVISVYALGSAVGGILAAFFVVPCIVRQGLYTNAEYLEARFGPSMRILSALIQLQYRSSMLGLIVWSLYLMLTRLIELPPVWAWVVIVTSVGLSGFYTAWGGLKTVVWTDAVQGIIMLLGGVVIFAAVWNAVGGWEGMTAGLASASQASGGQLPATDLAHIGRYFGDTGNVSPYVVVLGWTIIGSGYWTVNHTQTMRLMGTRSLWDMQMAALFGVAASLPIMISVACLGVFARALPEFQQLETPDTLYPLLVNRYLGPGLKGVVVAGIVAAAVSTFDSMGSALSAIFTRDVYARLIVKDGSDAHYVRVSRCATVGVLALGFLYLPFIIMQDNMLRAFTTLIPVFVTPLFAVYMVGVLTRAHRHSGMVGLLIGSAYGVLALVDREFVGLSSVPDWLSGRWVSMSWSLLVTVTAMAAVTAVLGVDPTRTRIAFQESGWLSRSREALPPIKLHPFTAAPPAWLNPNWYAVLLLAVCAWIVFGVFW